MLLTRRHHSRFTMCKRISSSNSVRKTWHIRKVIQNRKGRTVTKFCTGAEFTSHVLIICQTVWKLLRCANCLLPSRSIAPSSACVLGGSESGCCPIKCVYVCLYQFIQTISTWTATATMKYDTSKVILCVCMWSLNDTLKILINALHSGTLLCSLFCFVSICAFLFLSARWCLVSS